MGATESSPTHDSVIWFDGAPCTRRSGITKGDRVAAVLPNSIGPSWERRQQHRGHLVSLLRSWVLVDLARLVNLSQDLLTANAYQHNGNIYDCWIKRGKSQPAISGAGLRRPLDQQRVRA